MMTELEEEVKALIENIYKATYKGTLKINPILYDEVQIGFKVRLGLNVDERPIYIAFEGDKDQFIKYLLSELRVRRLSDTEFYYGDKIYKKNEECCHT